jgi:pyridoxal 5'-phosphate synthase pdxT subunit
MNTQKIGVLAFHGDVIEHIETLRIAAKRIKTTIDIVPVRTKSDLAPLSGIIIPGGESTTLYTLCLRENMIQDLKKVPAIFGTCAGAILMAKHVLHKAPEQKTLECMDIQIDRNAYGAQTESFEKMIQTTLGPMSAIFIRAPKIKKVGKALTVLATDEKEIIACEQQRGKQYLLACAFHPEMTTSRFHEHFLRHTRG